MSAPRPSPTSGKRASQPSRAATSSSSLCAPVTATACLAKARPARAYASAATSIPLRVSFVPPDFEITTVSVSGRPPSVAAMRESSRAMPSGSVLSKKNGRSGSRGEPSASATNCGPSAEPPIPTARRFVKRPAFSGATRPAWTAEANSSIRASVPRIASAVSGVGRELRRAQPVVADAPLLVRVRDRALLERVHRGEGGGEGGRHERVAPERVTGENRLRQVDEEGESGHVERESLDAGPVVSGHDEPPPP